jgi:hypothetical protein
MSGLAYRRLIQQSCEMCPDPCSLSFLLFIIIIVLILWVIMFLSPLFILAVIVCILLIDGIALAGATIEENTLCDHDRGLRKGKKSGSSSAEPRSDFPLVSPEHKKRKPSWWRIYKKYMKKHHSISLKNCAVPETVEPTTGMKCQKPKRDSYFCMFGEQRCESNQVKGKKHPAVLCECQSDETLKCDDWKPCISDEAVTKDQVTTCPGEDEAPKTGYVCNWVPEMECSYGTLSSLRSINRRVHIQQSNNNLSLP